MKSQRVLRRKYRAKIVSSEVKDAYDCLVDGASAIKACRGYFTQEKPSFVFEGQNPGHPPYSFMVAENWLLFYFREPAWLSRKRQEERLRETFGERLSTKTKSDLDEWTVKVESEPEARFLVEEVLRAEFS